MAIDIALTMEGQWIIIECNDVVERDFYYFKIENIDRKEVPILISYFKTANFAEVATLY